MQRDRFKSIFSRIFLVALFVFAVISNVRLIIRNYQLHERIKAAQTDVASLELRNQKLSLLMNYYQSSSYQDVEARRRLGMKLPDEAAYIIKGISLPATSDIEATVTAEKSSTDNQSNAQKWWSYLSGK